MECQQKGSIVIIVFINSQEVIFLLFSTGLLHMYVTARPAKMNLAEVLSNGWGRSGGRRKCCYGGAWGEETVALQRLWSY